MWLKTMVTGWHLVPYKAGTKKRFQIYTICSWQIVMPLEIKGQIISNLRLKRSLAFSVQRFVDLLDPLVPSALIFVAPQSLSSQGRLQVLQSSGVPGALLFTSILLYKVLLYDNVLSYICIHSFVPNIPAHYTHIMGSKGKRTLFITGQNQSLKLYKQGVQI